MPFLSGTQRALLRAVPRFDMKAGERLVPIREIPPGDAPHLMAQLPPWPAQATDNSGVTRKDDPGVSNAGSIAAGAGGAMVTVAAAAGTGVGT